MSLQTLFAKMNPNVQISMVLSMTIISSIVYGNFQIPMVCMFAPFPTVSMLNVWKVITETIQNFNFKEVSN